MDAADLLRTRPRLLTIAKEVERQGHANSTSIARALQLNPGSVLRDLRLLERHSLLASSPRGTSAGPSGGGSVFAPAGLLLQQAISIAEADQTRGKLQPGVAVVLVGTHELGALARALLAPQAREAILWLSVCADSSMGAVVALRATTAGNRTSVLAWLRAHGLTPRPVVIETLLGPDEIRPWADQAASQIADSQASTADTSRALD